MRSLGKPPESQGLGLSLGTGLGLLRYAARFRDRPISDSGREPIDPLVTCPPELALIHSRSPLLTVERQSPAPNSRCALFDAALADKILGMALRGLADRSALGFRMNPLALRRMS